MENTINEQSTLRDWFTGGIRITWSKSNFTKQVERSGHSDADTVRLHFGLSGDYSVRYPQFNQHFELAGGHQNLFYSHGFDMHFINKTSTIETFGIQFPRSDFLSLAAGGGDKLRRFAEKIDKGENALYAQSWAPVGIRSQQVIREIITANYRDDLKQLFLYAKCIELLVLSMESFEHDDANHTREKSKKSINNKQDIERLMAARDLINERLRNPPALPELARLIGINEYKLKTGFKALFGSTVFDYLNNQRLQLAFQTLKESGQTAAEIGYALGYGTPQHFNNAFRKKFGCTPNMVRKNP